MYRARGSIASHHINNTINCKEFLLDATETFSNACVFLEEDLLVPASGIQSCKSRDTTDSHPTPIPESLWTCDMTALGLHLLL